MNATFLQQSLLAKFENKEYRDAFVGEQIFSRLPLKIRCLREEQGLTQRKLGDLAGMAQTWVSKLEDPNYGKLTISTLLKVASAFDVGLQIDFVPFSKIIADSVRLSPAAFTVPAFAKDTGLNDAGAGGFSAPVNHSTGAFTGTVLAFAGDATKVSAVADVFAPGSAPSAPQGIAV